MDYKSITDELGICVIIPTYNNALTLKSVIDGINKYTNNIIVVNDGSSDNTDLILKNYPDFEIISYDQNKGKGYAIQKAFALALSLGYSYAITIDSDGQHSTDDMPVFVDKIKNQPNSLIIGSRNIKADGMPAKNTFANKFSNFWYWVETNTRLPDTQSGYRLYPIKLYRNTRFFTNKFEFEIEVLVRSSWSNIPVIPVPVNVYYARGEERISHFRPLQDFTRISILNTVLVLITLFYIVPKKVFRYLTRNKFTKVVKEQIMLHNENPTKISLAIGFGIFMGIVPIWGFQMIVAALLAHLFRLNKIIVLAFSNISIPPFIPVIIYFSYVTGGHFVDNQTEFTSDKIQYLVDQIINGSFYDALNELGYSIMQYVIGSIVLGITLAFIFAAISYLILLFIRSNNSTSANNNI